MSVVRHLIVGQNVEDAEGEPEFHAHLEPLVVDVEPGAYLKSHIEGLRLDPIDCFGPEIDSL